MIINLFRYFSFRYLLLHPFRTFLTFLGVALGISLYLSISLLNDGTRKSLDRGINAMTGKADLTVTTDGIGFDANVAEKIKTVADVKSVIPLIINYAYFADKVDPTKKTSIVFLGVDLLKDSSVRDYKTTEGEIIPDPLAFLNQPDSIIATKSWAKRHNLHMDDTIELLTKEGVKSFAIRGLIEESGPAKAFDGNMAIMDIDGAMYNFGREGLVDRIDVILWGDRKVQDVKTELKRTLGPRFKVEDKKEQLQSMQQLVESIQEVSGLLGIISFLVGFLIVVNTVNTAISQRRKDIGSLRTFGAGTSHIIILFGGEFLFLALCSSLFGGWLGLIIAQSSADRVAAGLNSSLLANITTMEIVFTSKHLVASLLLGFISSTTALVYPLYKALQIHPIEAIKPQPLDFSVDKKPTLLYLSGLVGFLLIVLTYTLAVMSPDIEILQSKSLQPLFLLTGIGGIVLMGPFIVLMVLSGLHRLSLPFIFKFSLANLLKNPGRTASTCIHLSLGFSLVIIISAINISFRKTIIGWAEKITSHKNVVNVTSWGSMAGFQAQPLHESIKEKLLEVPGLDHSIEKPVTGLRIVPVSINNDRFIIKAFDNPGRDKFYRFLDGISEYYLTRVDKLFSPER
jgi:putative ABC transport system permease protein